MLDYFNIIYGSIHNKSKVLTKIRFYSLLRVIVRNTANLLLFIEFKMTKFNPRYKLDRTKSNENSLYLIVSLTSFPKRINRLWLTVETILRQTHKPDRLILWLSEEQFPNLNVLPKSLLEQRKRGLEIRICKGDIRSHKKYYYVLKEFPKSTFITIDDDIFYPTRMLEELLLAHKKFPKAIIARYGHKIKYSNDKLCAYNKWESYYTNKVPDTLAFFGSGGGTLFPANSLSDHVINKDLFLELCPTADDVWLNFMARINGTKILLLKDNEKVLLPVLNFNDERLARENVSNNLNDTQIKSLQNYFEEEHGINIHSTILDA